MIILCVTTAQGIFSIMTISPYYRCLHRKRRGTGIVHSSVQNIKNRWEHLQWIGSTPICFSSVYPLEITTSMLLPHLSHRSLWKARMPFCAVPLISRWVGTYPHFGHLGFQWTNNPSSSMIMPFCAHACCAIFCTSSKERWWRLKKQWMRSFRKTIISCALSFMW